jgi:hypothetical protein
MKLRILVAAAILFLLGGAAYLSPLLFQPSPVERNWDEAALTNSYGFTQIAFTFQMKHGWELTDTNAAQAHTADDPVERAQYLEAATSARDFLVARDVAETNYLNLAGPRRHYLGAAHHCAGAAPFLLAFAVVLLVAGAILPARHAGRISSTAVQPSSPG